MSKAFFVLIDSGNTGKIKGKDFEGKFGNLTRSLFFFFIFFSFSSPCNFAVRVRKCSFLLFVDTFDARDP